MFSWKTLPMHFDKYITLKMWRWQKTKTCNFLTVCATTTAAPPPSPPPPFRKNSFSERIVSKSQMELSRTVCADGKNSSVFGVFLRFRTHSHLHWKKFNRLGRMKWMNGKFNKIWSTLQSLGLHKFNATYICDDGDQELRNKRMDKN